MQDFVYESTTGTTEQTNKTPRYIRNAELSNQQVKLLSFETDHDGHARAVEFLYGNCIRYTDQQGWFFWNGKCWKSDRHEVKRLVIDTLRKRKSVATLADEDRLLKRCNADNSNINAIMVLLESYVTAEITDFDQEDDFLPAPNGIIDLRTGTLLPHNPDKKFTYTANVAYDLNADYSEWENFLLTNVEGGEETVKALQMFAGYMLTGHTREEKMLYLYGVPRAGKGTFTETLQSLLPDPIAQEKGMNSFTARRDEDTDNFDLASTRSARMVFASEPQRYHALNAAKIKAITGGNQISAAYKGKDSFRYKPKFKICLSSNFEVNADVDDDAIWARLIVFVFPNSYVGREDTTFKKRLQTDEAKQGVLKWAVEGAAKWYKAGKLAIPESIKKTAQEQRSKLDTVAMWIDECVSIDENAFTTSADIRASYDQWCKENGVEPKRARFLAEALERRLPQIQKTIQYVEGSVIKDGFRTAGKKRARGYIGLTFASESYS